MRVARAYVAQYADPITVRAGDRVEVGANDPEFPGWWWCIGPDQRAGWVPAQLLRREGRAGVMLRDYTARELSVHAGADVTVGEEFGGWIWVTAADGMSGWIPTTCLAPE